MVREPWFRRPAGRPGVRGRLAARLTPGQHARKVRKLGRTLQAGRAARARGQRSGAGRAAAARTRHGRSVRAPAGSCLLLRVSPAVRIAASHHWRRPGRFLRAGARGRGPGKGPGPSRHNEDAGPGASLGARPAGRALSSPGCAPRPHQRRPCCLAACRGPSTAAASSPGARLGGGAQTPATGPAAPKGQSLVRLELMSAGSRRNSAPGRNDQRHGAKDAKTGPAAVPQERS